MVKICLCGAGRIGSLHAEHIATHPRAELVAIVDPKEPAAAELASRWNTRALPSLEEALKLLSFDAVLIASSADSHADLIDLAAAHGKGIFCEKPIDLNLPRAEECLVACATAKVPLLMGFNRRFDPSFIYLKQQLDEGRIGTIEQLILISREPELLSLDYLQKAGSIFHDLTVSDFDLARWLLGEEPIEVYATGSCLIEPKLMEFGDYDSAMVVLRTGSGKLCHISNSRRALYGFDQRAEVLGSKGVLQVDQVQALPRGPNEPYFVNRYRKSYLNELDHFIDVIEKGIPPLVNGLDARQALVLAEAAKQSAESNHVVEVAHLIPVP